MTEQSTPKNEKSEAKVFTFPFPDHRPDDEQAPLSLMDISVNEEEDKELTPSPFRAGIQIQLPDIERHPNFLYFL